MLADVEAGLFEVLHGAGAGTVLGHAAVEQMDGALGVPRVARRWDRPFVFVWSVA